MVLKYDIEIADATVRNQLRKFIDQTYKLLPTREEGSDWQKPLDTLIIEIAGLGSLWQLQAARLLEIVMKLEGLHRLTSSKDFYLYRKTIFECISLLSEVVTTCQD